MRGVGVYRARALGRVTQAKLDTLKDGIVVEGVSYGSIEATLDKAKEKDDGRANVWITLALNEGKNREVRRVLEALGLKVNRLLRLAYGPFQLGTLAQGEVEEVGPRVIREQLADFIAPENLPAGTRTATPTPAAGRRAGSALADPRRKPSRVRADDEKKAAEAIEREDRAPRDRPARGDKPGKPFGAKPRREGGFGDRKGPGAGEKRPRSDRATGEGRASSFGDKKPRSGGGFGARKSSDAERPRSDRTTGARKTSGFGEKPARGEGGFGARKASAGGEERRPRTDRAAGTRNASSFGEKRPRDEGARAERKPSAYGDKKPRSGPGFGRGKPAARTGEARPYKRREDFPFRYTIQRSRGRRRQAAVESLRRKARTARGQALRQAGPQTRRQTRRLQEVRGQARRLQGIRRQGPQLQDNRRQRPRLRQVRPAARRPRRARARSETCRRQSPRTQPPQPPWERTSRTQTRIDHDRRIPDLHRPHPAGERHRSPHASRRPRRRHGRRTQAAHRRTRPARTVGQCGMDRRNHRRHGGRAAGRAPLFHGRCAQSGGGPEGGRTNLRDRPGGDGARRRPVHRRPAAERSGAAVPPRLL